MQWLICSFLCIISPTAAPITRLIVMLSRNTALHVISGALCADQWWSGLFSRVPLTTTFFPSHLSSPHQVFTYPSLFLSNHCFHYHRRPIYPIQSWKLSLYHCTLPLFFVCSFFMSTYCVVLLYASYVSAFLWWNKVSWGQESLFCSQSMMSSPRAVLDA